MLTAVAVLRRLSWEVLSRSLEHVLESSKTMRENGKKWREELPGKY